jgi:anti-sigma B factor antagonist
MADKLSFDVTYSAGVITAKAEGVLGFMTAPDLKKKLAAWIEPGIREVILDLKEINHVDSAGIAAVLQAIKVCEAADVTFFVKNPPLSLRVVLNKSGLSNLLASDG